MNLKIKSLLIISLLIFMLPFFQTCSDQTIRENICFSRTVALPIDDSLIAQKEIDNEASKEEKMQIASNEEKECLREKRKHYTFNAYYLGFNHLLSFENKHFLDGTFYMFSIYTIIIVVTFFMLAFVFKTNIKCVYSLSILNLILAIIWLCALPLFDLIDEFSQIKYGYYLFVLNSVLVVVESKKLLEKSKSNLV